MKSFGYKNRISRETSLPSWERGLKWVYFKLKDMEDAVAPLVGARVEITRTSTADFVKSSLPSWERGLKSKRNPIYRYPGRVAPLVGARVEMAVHTTQQNASRVAPLVGARVEMSRKVSHVKGPPVAPLVGARVEIYYKRMGKYAVKGRSPRGSAG